MEKKQSLYDITSEQRELMEEIISMEGEITPEMEEKLAITKSSLNQKSIAYLEIISAKKAQNSMIDNEIKRLQAFKKRNNNLVSKLDENLLVAVKTFGTYEVGLQKFGTRKSTGVIINDRDSIPTEFLKTTVTTNPDKATIKAELLAGNEVEGAELEHRLNLKIN